MNQKRGAILGRHDLFTLLGVTGVSFACPAGSRAQSSVQSGMTFILDVTGTVASPALIDDLLEPLLERHIPRGWIHGELTDPRATRAALEAARRTGAAMEIIPHSVRIVDRRPFFRMHAAHIARQEADRLLADQPETAVARPIAIATDDPGAARSFEGVRTAGFRHVFPVPAQTAPSESHSQEGQVSVISGGVVADLARAGDGLVGDLATRIASAPLLPVYLTLHSAEDQPREALRARMEALARQVAD